MTKRTSRICWLLASSVALAAAIACSNDDSSSSSSDDATGGAAGEKGSGGEASESGGSNAGGDGSGGDGSGGSDASGGNDGLGGAAGGDGTGGGAPVCTPLADGARVWLTMSPKPPVEGEPPPSVPSIEDRLGRMDLDPGLQSFSGGPAKVGSAVNFDGDLVLWRSGADVGVFYFDAVEFWLKTSSTSAGLVHFNDCAGFCDGQSSPIFSQALYDLRLSNGKLSLSFRDKDGGGSETDGSQRVLGKTNVADGTFHHIAAVLDKTDGTVALYVDGKLDIDAEAGLDADLLDWPAQMQGPLNVGARREVGNPAAAVDFLTGVIDELSFYEKPLSKDQVAAIYEADTAGKCVPQ